MTATACPGTPPERCDGDARRRQVRASGHLAGIDYVEVYPDRVRLCLHFFGTPPQQLSARHVVIDGGVRVRGIRVLSAAFQRHADGDTCLLLKVDQPGDFSTYCACLVEPPEEPEPAVGVLVASQPRARGTGVPGVPQGIDPRYACAPFSFRADCPASADCAPAPCPPAATGPLPAIDYLARDFESFRRLMLDRLALTLPAWQERHAPDLMLTLVELLAYAADQLSYELDAVGTEAFLRTARRRISVRRHARLVDYRMHDGCNARAWVTLATDADLPGLLLRDLAFAAYRGPDAPRGGGLVDWATLRDTPGALVFEPLALDGRDRVDLWAAHSEIGFHTWSQGECCLPAGSTRATLRDAPPEAPERPAALEGGGRAAAAQPRDVPPPARAHRLKLGAGLYLLLEETRGCSGVPADADPGRRHVVRLTRATPMHDPLDGTPVWEVAWSAADALPFDLRLSVRSAAPECRELPAAVARGNLLLVDHGASTEPRDEWTVPVASQEACCVCDGAAVVTRRTAGPLRIALEAGPLTQAEPLQADRDSTASLLQARDPRRALPALSLQARPPRGAGADDSAPAESWEPVHDLLASGPDDRHVVVEVDDTERAQLRFGDDVLGEQPAAGWRFRARCRIGNGPVANIGHDALVWMACRGRSLSGLKLALRNPLPAVGGTAPEAMEDVKIRAPQAYGRVLERAVAAEDYAQLAQMDARLQGANAELTWTGSGYEVQVALDPLAGQPVDAVTAAVQQRLERARRIGHGLRMVPARRVPIAVALAVCVAPHQLRTEVERSLRALLSNRTLPDGTRGLFHPDGLRFGADVAASRLVAAVQAVPGVVHVELLSFARLDATPQQAQRSLQDNLIAIAADEVAVLDADPSLPELGRLDLTLKGGR